MSVGSKIKELRLKNNVTQEELANKIKVTGKTVSRWENDILEPSLDSLKAIAKYFGVSVDYILDIESVSPSAPAQRENVKLVWILELFCVLVWMATSVLKFTNGNINGGILDVFIACLWIISSIVWYLKKIKK